MYFLGIVAVLFVLVAVLGLFAAFYKPSSPSIASLDDDTFLDENGWESKAGLYVNGPKKGQLL